MKRWILGFCVLAMVVSTPSARGYTLSGQVLGGQTGLTLLKYVFAVPATLDTFYVTIAIPFLNTYAFLNLDSGGYVLFAYQDLNTNIVPDLDEPRGFYGGDIPQVFQLLGDSSGVDIELHPPNQGGFSGSISYSGANTGTTLILAHYTPDFSDLPHGGSLLFNNTGSGDYTALVDSFTTYYAYAFMDVNNNFAWDPGEPRGVYGGEAPQPIVVQETNFPENIDIMMEETSGIALRPFAQAKSFTLEKVYPNPFNSIATVAFTLAYPLAIELSVFDVLGRQVATLTRGMYTTGEHQVPFDAEGLASGVYLVRLSGSEGRVSKPVLLVR
ncbi:T9SS type A sorting domain-containing protein [bacterium]|nr:T9SS type A sorting domain-containing protein [bacterium]MBU1982994.1 T9SS type A sorting domain-containing protein [bacterium]